MNKDLISAAVDCLRIRLIVLREARLTMNPEFDPTAPAEWGVQSKIGLKNVVLGERNEPGKVSPVKFIRGHVEAGVRLVPLSKDSNKQDSQSKDEGAFVAAELLATFTAEYDCAEGAKDLSNDAVSEFLNHNAVFHVWPYWREYVQSTFARALLPHVTLPMMVVTPAKQPNVVETKPEPQKA